MCVIPHIIYAILPFSICVILSTSLGYMGQENLGALPRWMSERTERESGMQIAEAQDSIPRRIYSPGTDLGLNQQFSFRPAVLNRKLHACVYVRVCALVHIMLVLHWVQHLPSSSACSGVRKWNWTDPDLGYQYLSADGASVKSGVDAHTTARPSRAEPSRAEPAVSGCNYQQKADEIKILE